MASDSLAGRWTTSPLPPLAWGFAGDEGVGLEFDKWIHAYAWPDVPSWRAFVDEAIGELSQLNGRKRELAEIARVKLEDHDLTSVLMVGFVAGVLDMWELTDRGSAASVKHHGFVAIGSGYPLAFIAYQTIKRAERERFKPRAAIFAFALEIGAEHANLCAPPIRLLRVDANGVTDLGAKTKTDGDAGQKEQAPSPE